MDFITLFGYGAIVYILFSLVQFLRFHFFTTTNYAKYGAKQGAFALVTGASEGIGRGFAEALASRGFNVIIAARKLDTLKQVASEIETKYKTRVVAVRLDASEPDAVEKLVQEVRSYDVRVLVNNVGVNTQLPTNLADMSQDEVQRMVQINVAFTTRLTYAMLPALQKNKRSLVLFLSSFSGIVPVPMMAIYSATKAYNDVFARALSTELKSSGVDVSSIVPHFVVSPMSGFKRASLRVPMPVPFAQQALNKLSFKTSISPNIFHDIEMRLVPLLPESFVGSMALKTMQTARAKLLRRQEKEKESTKTK